MAKTWRERLAEPITDEIVQLAAHWDTCAVGEQHAQHPEVVRYCTTRVMRSRAPRDRPLARLGAYFYLHVNRRDPDAAGRMLDAIEDRVLVLKRGEESPA